MILHDMVNLDLDTRESMIRWRVYDDSEFWSRKAEVPDAVVATYFIRSRRMSLAEAGKAISYHMTTADKHPTPGTLLAECTGRVEDVLAWDASDRTGLVRVAFPLRLFQHENGSYYTSDFLHLAGGAGVFELWELGEAKLVDILIPAAVIATFPGPAYGCAGIRELTHWPSDEAAFGTILKPTAGITDDDVERLVAGVADEPLFMFVKEDENLLPCLPYCPAASRARKGWDVIRRAAAARDGKGLIYAPHVTAPPHLLLDVVKRVIETGVNGIMFSEQYTGGTVRAVRELTKTMDKPPAIYGHNGGIGIRTNFIWREVLDLFARLDGIDFRQTAPLTSGMPLLRPQGLEWRKSEEALSKPINTIKPVMVTRAGGLDHGNILLNMADAARNLPAGQCMFLAGSAINSIKDPGGRTSPKLGAQGMREAIALWQSGDIIVDVENVAEHVQTLYCLAKERGLKALTMCLEQRYKIK